MVIKCIYMCIFYVYINTIITFIMSLKLKGEINYKGQIEYWCNVKGYGLIKYNNRQALVHSSNCVREKDEWILQCEFSCALPFISQRSGTRPYVAP